MSALVDAVFVGGSLLLAVPCCVFFFECLLGSLGRVRRDAGADAGVRPRVGVIVPAHDERAGITRTLNALRAELSDNDVLLVVADNCTDDTAEVARGCGARVAERFDAERRGKGYALAFGLEQLAADPPEVVVIVDADCLVSSGAIEQIARLARHTDRPVQADYLLQSPRDATGLSVVSALAFIVKNRVRPRGLAVLGLPCLLTGTGMAFPWRVMRMAPPTEGNLVEDMVMGFDLACLGHPPLLCPEAHVTSELPSGTQAASSQRKRWEHGHLATLSTHAPRLFAEGLRKGNLGLIALALDLCVPPLSLLVIAVVFATLVAVAFGFVTGYALPAQVLALSLTLVFCGVVLAYVVHGRQSLRVTQLLSIPFYVLWKIPLYFSFLVRGKQKTWERTERAAGIPNDSQKP